MNTACHRHYQSLDHTNLGEVQARQLCEYWASDYRTHIEPGRWSEIERELFSGFSNVFDENNSGVEQHPSIRVVYSHDELVMDVATDQIRLSLNLHRGLSIRSLAFQSQGLLPVMGTMLQGYFDCISLGMDFYSANLTAEYADPPRRIADLQPVMPQLSYKDDGLYVSGSVITDQGVIEKKIYIPAKGEDIHVTIDASSFVRKTGRVRIAAMTVLTQHVKGPYWHESMYGGAHAERFTLDKSFDDAQAVSPLVSARSGLGASDG